MGLHTDRGEIAVREQQRPRAAPDALVVSPQSGRNPTLLIATPQAVLRDRWRRGLQERFRILEVAGYRDLARSVIRLSPDVLVVDAVVLPIDGIGAVRRWSLASTVLLMVGTLDAAETISLLKAGAKGYCQRESGVALVRKAVDVVKEGGVWIDGRVAARLVEELRLVEDLRRTSRGSVAGALEDLTSREREVALLVADGARNKEIASLLCITEATVKAHLTSVFRKLELRDRLHLGLLLAVPAKDRKRLRVRAAKSDGSSLRLP
jgi:DNA-binding NarL/FixJ family response regulator